MSAPQTLTRPLAQRVAALADVPPVGAAPAVSPGVIDAAADALVRGQTHYTDRPGIGPLREQVVGALGRRFGIELDAGQVTITCGATEARFVAVKQLSAGKAILGPGGAGAIGAAAALVGVPVVASVDDPSAVSILYLTPADDPAAAAPLLERARAHGWWVIFDTTVAGDALPHPARGAALAGQVVSIGSYSDALPGWRVGWMAGSSAVNKLRAYKQSLTICTTSVSQWAALGLEREP